MSFFSLWSTSVSRMVTNRDSSMPLAQNAIRSSSIETSSRVRPAAVAAILVVDLAQPGEGYVVGHHHVPQHHRQHLVQRPVVGGRAAAQLADRLPAGEPV